MKVSEKLRKRSVVPTRPHDLKTFKSCRDCNNGRQGTDMSKFCRFGKNLSTADQESTGRLLRAYVGRLLRVYVGRLLRANLGSSIMLDVRPQDLKTFKSCRPSVTTTTAVVTDLSKFRRFGINFNTALPRSDLALEDLDRLAKI